MKRAILNTTMAAVLLTISQVSSASLLFNEDVTSDIIFGSGNANGGFTVDRNNGIELGLRGKLRHNAAGAPENTFNSNGDGTYSFNAGVAPTQSSPTAEWSFEWSINTNWDESTNFNLASLNYQLGLDMDPSLNTSYSVFDPIHDDRGSAGNQWDHAIGNNSTGSGAGTSIRNNVSDVAGYQSLIANNNLAQQSWKPHWFISGFDPTVDGTYNFFLAAFDDAGNQLARTDIQIIVGAGGTATVSETGSLALLGLGLAGLGFARRKKRS